MSNSSQARNRALALRCYRMAEAGVTYRSIAELVGKRPEQIKALIELGARVLSIDSHDAAQQQEPSTKEKP